MEGGLPYSAFVSFHFIQIHLLPLKLGVYVCVSVYSMWRRYIRVFM